MKFVHAADIHLDSPLRGLEKYEGAPAEELRGATRKALVNLVDLAIEEKVAFVLIAGDIYDGDWPDYNTGLFFNAQMARLNKMAIPVFFLRGNHDAASKISKSVKLPANVEELSHTKPASIELREHNVILHGQGFASQSVTEDLTVKYPLAREGWFNIGLLHTSLDGRPGHDNYAPCSIPRLKEKGYDYWALGHIHQREVLCEDPWIVFPGNIQGRHARETGPKGCTLVSVEDGRVTLVEHRDLDVVRWIESTVDVSECSSRYDVEENVRQGLEELFQSESQRTLAVRLRIAGRTSVHGDLVAHREDFIQQCRSMGTDVSNGSIWIEKVKIETAQREDSIDFESRSDAIGSLVRYLRSGQHSKELIAELALEFRELSSKLPTEVKQDKQDPFDPVSAETVASLLPDVEALLRPRLNLAEGK